ncbi:type II toxin-antitoxin system PemK/MazF family toxin [Mesoflavibacter sp. SCSIO 43206]|uniref:type II toxin-antitoxin system PemK/MazF family toxin n=1 Tax=Mesoflavibacter sp. SCSIO 43206 TaxID=2779362 RepID=UPI001CAA20F2|nr:type II toxin-antitoxin system PemK/MazF family toxin [Mesoflavibacter sp. SCSIO 43206]UAB75583.1 type II toxin-antitoxin system PemK/MazF family toxin [Mesoflavibacter sp. SCSIO 43206]
MSYSQGDIVIVRFPYTNLRGSKARPAIVVSNSNVNVSSDYIVVMLTTQQISGQFAETISNDDITIDFNPPHSRMNVYCKKVAVLDDSVIHRRISQVSNQEKLQEILNKIKSAFDIV